VGGGRAGSRQLPSLSHDDMDNFRRTKHTETQEILEGKSSPRGKPGLQHSTFLIIALIRAQLCIQPQPTRSVRAILSRCFSFVNSVSSAFVKPPLPSPEPTLCSPRLPSPGTGGVHVAAEAAIAGDWHDEVDESPVGLELDGTRATAAAWTRSATFPSSSSDSLDDATIWVIKRSPGNILEIYWNEGRRQQSWTRTGYNSSSGRAHMK